MTGTENTLLDQIASKIVAMQKEIEDNHDGDPWNNGAITTLEEVKKLFKQPIERMYTRSQVQEICEATLQRASEKAEVIVVLRKYVVDKSSILDPDNIVIK